MSRNTEPFPTFGLMKHRVLLTQRFSEALVNRLRTDFPDLDITQKPVREQWDKMDTGPLFEGDEEVLYCFMPPRDLSKVPRLKWVQLHSAGINQLAGHPILKSNILVTSSSGIHAVPIGEFAIALMLALARRVPRMVRMQERREWAKHRWQVFLGAELRGETLGVVGYGSIGREVARIAKYGFGMRVLALTRSGSRMDRGYAEPGVGDPEGKLPDVWLSRDQLVPLFHESDFILISTPLTKETRALVGEKEIRAMKPTAYIVNIARGEIIDEEALVRALKENRIAGAGLDVFAHEPLPSESELWDLDNVLIAPHISSATHHYDERAVELFSENLRRYLRGEDLLNLVNNEIGY